MKELLQKLSSYNIFNYLLPGILFVGIAEKLTSYSFIHDDILIGLFLYYFFGLIISRIGSLIVEPFLRRVKFVRFADYPDFVVASKSDPEISLFSEQNNMFRTLCSLFIVLTFVKIYDEIKDTLPWSADTSGSIFLLLVLLLVLLLFSYRKQTQFVVQRIKIAKEKAEETEKTENAEGEE